MFTVDIEGIDAALRLIESGAKAVQRGSDIGVRELGRLGVDMGRPMIPVGPSSDPASGQTRRRLRATYQRIQGLLQARIAVRQPRRHIMRFLESGTKSHGRHGGPLPAHHIMERLDHQLEVLAKPMIEGAIALNMIRL